MSQINASNHVNKADEASKRSKFLARALTLNTKMDGILRKETKKIAKSLLATNMNSGLNLSAFFIRSNHEEARNTAITRSKERTKDRGVVKGYGITITVFIASLSKMSVPKAHGEKLNNNSIKLKVKEQILLSEDEKKAGNYDDKAKYKYEFCGEDRYIRVYDTLRINIFSSGKDGVIYKALKKATFFQPIDIIGLKANKITTKDGNQMTLIQASMIELGYHDINAFMTIRSNLPRFPYDMIPKLSTPIPTDEEVEEYVDKYFDKDMEKEKSARRMAWKNNMSSIEREFFTSSLAFRTDPSTREELEQGLTEEKGQQQTTTTWVKFFLDKESGETNGPKFHHRIIEGVLNCSQWNEKYGIPYSDNPDDIEAFAISFKMFDKVSSKLLKTTNKKEEWMNIAPIHIPKLPVWIFGYPDMTNTTDNTDKIVENRQKFQISFNCTDACSNLTDYLIRAGLQVTFDYVKNRVNKDGGADIITAVELENVPDEEETRLLKSTHPEIRNVKETDRYFITRKASEECVFFVLNNIEFTPEQIHIYKKWGKEKSKIISDVLMQKDEEHTKELGIKIPKEYYEFIYEVKKSVCSEYVSYTKELKNAPFKTPLEFPTENAINQNNKRKRVEDISENEEVVENKEEDTENNPKRRKLSPVPSPSNSQSHEEDIEQTEECAENIEETEECEGEDEENDQSDEQESDNEEEDNEDEEE